MSNEAAERLYVLLAEFIRDERAAEHKATVERIRVEVADRTWPVDYDGPTEDRIFAILDAELSASPETDSQAER